MASNLFIAYDLDRPHQNYDTVRAAIRSLGQWHQFQLSLFYVHTVYTPQEAYALVWASMDANDKLAAINCSTMLGALVTNWDNPPIDAINTIWLAA